MEAQPAPESPARSRSYVPALGYDLLTPLYDVVIALSLREESLKRQLIEHARIAPGQHVLDLGCGTGTLAIMLKQASPGAHVVGVDGDAKILEIARGKARSAAVEIELALGMAFDLPFPSRSFDRVLSTLVLHHLTTEEKRRALSEVRRILRSGGELHIADFGKPQNTLMWLVSLGVRYFDGGDRTAANLEGKLPDLIAEAGFSSVAQRGDTMTPFGTISLLGAVAL